MSIPRAFLLACFWSIIVIVFGGGLCAAITLLPTWAGLVVSVGFLVGMFTFIIWKTNNDDDSLVKNYEAALKNKQLRLEK